MLARAPGPSVPGSDIFGISAEPLTCVAKIVEYSSADVVRLRGSPKRARTRTHATFSRVKELVSDDFTGIFLHIVTSSNLTATDDCMWNAIIYIPVGVVREEAIRNESHQQDPINSVREASASASPAAIRLPESARYARSPDYPKDA